MTHYSIPGIPLCNPSSRSSKSAMNSWTQNCRKSPNFEISEGVPIKTRVPREVIMVILVVMLIALHALCQKRTMRFQKERLYL